MTRAAASAVAAAALVLGGWAGARADATRGARAFQRCYACHSVVAGEDKLPGPTLRCVLGRRAGTLPGYEFGGSSETPPNDLDCRSPWPAPAANLVARRAAPTR